MVDEVISEEELDARYREMIDSFIDRANEFTDHNSPENVGMALLYAASRFNAYVVSEHAEDLEAYEKDIEKAQEFFISQYRDMLSENLDDYKKVFEKYYKFTSTAKPQ
jgi:hypothetical protein